MKHEYLSLKQHIIIALTLFVWALLFTLLIKPFEHGEMNSDKWLFVALSFSLSAFICYICIAVLQVKILSKSITWDYRFEFLVILLFFILFSILTFLSYRSPLINGFYSLHEFLSKIILKITIIFTPILFISRQFARRHFIGSGYEASFSKEVILKGENKLDILKLKQSQIICASNAQNYVEISYLDGDKVHKKLIRASLKNLVNEHSFMLQIHRSHLINPEHFISWKDSSNIYLTQMELPVSKNYKNNLIFM